MDFVERIFATFTILIGTGFVVYMYPILSGLIVPALNGSGATGNIGWVDIVFPIVFFGTIFLVIILLFIKIWKSESED